MLQNADTLQANGILIIVDILAKELNANIKGCGIKNNSNAKSKSAKS